MRGLCVLCEVLDVTEVNFTLQQPFHGLCSQSPPFHRGGQGSTEGNSTQDLWWKMWHCDMSFSEQFPFPVSIRLPILHIHPIISLFIRRATGGSLGTFKTKQHWIQNYINAFFLPAGGDPLILRSFTR